jgi:hypothetical protein
VQVVVEPTDRDSDAQDRQHQPYDSWNDTVLLAYLPKHEPADESRVFIGYGHDSGHSRAYHLPALMMRLDTNRAEHNLCCDVPVT